jgi:hypothetical protein
MSFEMFLLLGVGSIVWESEFTDSFHICDILVLPGADSGLGIASLCFTSRRDNA